MQLFKNLKSVILTCQVLGKGVSLVIAFHTFINVRFPVIVFEIYRRFFDTYYQWNRAVSKKNFVASTTFLYFIVVFYLISTQSQNATPYFEKKYITPTKRLNAQHLVEY